jgi:Porin PorA
VRGRGVTGLVLCGLGAALIALAPLLHFWVAPSLIKAPRGGDVVSDASGDNITYLDFNTTPPTEKTGTVHSRDVYHGIDDDSTKSVSVYTLTSEIYATAEPALGTDLIAGQERFAVDRDSALAVPDPRNKERVDNDVDNEKSVHSGLIYKFPIGTEKHSYPFWDSHIRSSQYPMEYRGEVNVAGLNTYQFEQSIPDTVLPDQDPETHYVSHRTVFIDPATGVIIKGTQDVDIMTGKPGDKDRLVVLRGTFTFTDQNIADSAKRAKDNGSTITLLKVTLPIVFLILGILVLVAGLLLGRQARPDGEQVGGKHGSPDDVPATSSHR